MNEEVPVIENSSYCSKLKPTNILIKSDYGQPIVLPSLIGCSELFKGIVAGDTINGEYKGKDLFSFVPRSKLIISINNEMTLDIYTTGATGCHHLCSE